MQTEYLTDQRWGDNWSFAHKHFNRFLTEYYKALRIELDEGFRIGGLITCALGCWQMATNRMSVG